MIDQIYKCDVCKATRGPGNHWLMVEWTMRGDRRVPIILAWDASIADHPDFGHLCGAQCAHTTLDNYLSRIPREPKTDAAVI